MENEIEDREFSGLVISAAIEVHKLLGPGLLESAYELALLRELNLRGVVVDSQVAVPLNYKGTDIGAGYRIDILVEKQLVLEIKSVETASALHAAQVVTYLKLGNYQNGLLINFNVELLKDGIKRLYRPKPRSNS